MPNPIYPTGSDGGAWREFKASQIGVNNSFGGTTEEPTTNPTRPLGGEETIRVYVAGDRVLFVELPERGDDGWLFKTLDGKGVNIHGGNHTTENWFTFGIDTFYVVNDAGETGPQFPRLSSKLGFEGVNTLTPVNPGPIPCFGPDVIVETLRGPTRVADVVVGDQVWTCEPGTGRQAYRTVIWRGTRTVMASDEKTTPILVRGEEFSPLHRIMIEGAVYQFWIQARFLAEIGQAELTEQDGRTVEYHHLMLPSHTAIVTEHLLVESLLNTPLSSELFGGAEFPEDCSTALGLPDIKRSELETLQAGFAQMRYTLMRRPLRNVAIPVVV